MEAHEPQLVTLQECWAQRMIEHNPIRQLLVPGHQAVIETDDEGHSWAVGRHGRWMTFFCGSELQRLGFVGALSGSEKCADDRDPAGM